MVRGQALNREFSLLCVMSTSLFQKKSLPPILEKDKKHNITGENQISVLKDNHKVQFKEKVKTHNKKSGQVSS